MGIPTLTEILRPIVADLTAGEATTQIRVRDLLRLAGAARRGWIVSSKIRKTLNELGVKTIPDFETVPIDAWVSFALNNPLDVTPHAPSVNESGEDAELVDPIAIVEPDTIVTPEFIFGAVSEPAYRVSRLPAANTTLITVKPDESLTQAVTLMLRHDYSQLPVMTNERDVKGVISWESIAPKLALTQSESVLVRDYMKEHKEINASESIFSAIPRIVEHSYVLVRASDRRISGIITTTDLSLQFQQLSEPFLLLSEIENHIRKLIDGKFTKEELSGVVNPSDRGRTIESVADLTFGEYIRLFESPELWRKTGLKVDRAIFTKELDKVRVVRNDVMHFDPDGISEDDHELLHHFVRFIHEVQGLASLA
ncbi:HPP family protein [Pseudomonas sp. BJa3]|uniref:CBS domain-containing protein n=1 Tax=Pseudomonas sp. BJa3 TaxID=2986525 RepID=UPI0022659AB5|nr:CBS domain-containing protein [Pseudomonas sp. BJa3]MCX5511096.1 CBS domain-containing protein [Pseudomonas sp. BJa3]